MVTIKEIAKECNVSVATVSNILNHKPGASDETRRIVMAKIKELNYKPNTVARNLKTKNTRTIGVIVEDMTIFSIPDIVDGITEHCEENNYQILLINLRLFKKYNDFYYHRDDYYDRVEQEIDNFINEKKYDLKEEVSVKSDYYLNTNHEYEVKCQILENGSHLIDMTLTVPTQTEAEAIVNNWNRKNQEIYALLLSQLL